MTTVTIADLFCGAGGTSTGAVQAVEQLGMRAKLTAVNHWDLAVETHSANHPGARHLCASLDALNPRQLFRDGELDLLWASPECTHHSRARGGKPVPILARALGRQSWGVAPLGPEVVAGQQRIADTFLQLGLLPRPIQVADAIRQARS